MILPAGLKALRSSAISTVRRAENTFAKVALDLLVRQIYCMTTSCINVSNPAPITHLENANTRRKFGKRLDLYKL